MDALTCRRETPTDRPNSRHESWRGVAGYVDRRPEGSNSIPSGKVGGPARSGPTLLAVASLLLFVGVLPWSPPPAGAITNWTIEQVALDGWPAIQSLALDSSGTPHVFFQSSQVLRYATRMGPAMWNSEDIAPINVSGPGGAVWGGLVIDRFDQAHVVWWPNDNNNAELWYARRDPSGWTTQQVDAWLGGGPEPCIAADRMGWPGIAYTRKEANGSHDLHFARWNGTVWLFQTIDFGVVAQHCRLQFDSLDRPQVSYYDFPLTNGTVRLKYASWTGLAWAIQTIRPQPFSGYSPVDLALDAMDRPHVSDHEGGGSSGSLLHIQGNGTGWATTPVDSPRVGSDTAIALDLGGKPYISYNLADGPLNRTLMVARWNGTAWSNDTVDSGVRVGVLNDIAIDLQGRVHVAYMDNLLYIVKYALGTPNDAPPVSAVNALSPYWWSSSPLALQATASDPNGPVAWVDLHYRFDGGPGWGPWTSFGTDLAAPWQWSFPWPGGEGRYEFYSQAFDGAEWELQAPLADTAAGYRIPRDPPRNVTTTWDGTTGVGLSWDAPAVAPDHYLIFRAEGDPRGFAELTSAAAYDVAYPPATAWSDPDALAGPEERYYVLRGADAAETDLSPTSNTAGVFAGTLRGGLTAVSRPLEYFPWVDYAAPGQDDTLAEYTAAFGATRIDYLDTAGTWQVGSSQTLAVGDAYLLTGTLPGTFVFTGLPGSQIQYDEGPAGFTLAEARSLTATVSGNDITLSWTTPAAVASLASLEVWHGTTRTGIFDGTANPLASLPTATMAFTHAGALLGGDEHYYWIVPRDLSGELAASTYSVGVWAKTFRTQDTLALPLRPDVAQAVSGYTDTIPGALGILWLTASGAWVPHFTAMAAGVFDAPVAVGSGVQISVRSAAPVRYVFVGG